MDQGDVAPPPKMGDRDENLHIHRAGEALDMLKRSLGAVEALPPGFALVMGGDHSLAIASIGAMAARAKGEGRPLAVIWFDAHADFNTPESSPSGNLHGMPVKILTGHGPRPFLDLLANTGFLPESAFHYIGVRAVDEEEARLVAASHMSVAGMDQVGRVDLIQSILNAIAPNAHIHISFDVDGLDPAIAPGVGTREEGGIMRAQMEEMLEALAKSGRVGSMDVYELNPLLDHESQTVRLVIDLLHHFFKHYQRGPK